MNNILKRLITVFLSLFLLSYVGYQAYLALYHPIRTVSAGSSTVRDFISADAFVLHNETLIPADAGSGVIDYTRTDGGRVPKGGVVANVYATAQDAQNAQSLQEIKEKIVRLQQIGTAEDATAIDLNVLNGEIGSSFLALEDSVSSSNLGSLESSEQNLLDQLNRQQLATGQVKDFSAEIAALNQQETVLSAKAGGSVKSLVSPVSGYFVSSIDGYEGMYDAGAVMQIKPADIIRLESAKPSVKSGYAGKVISDFEWYITTVMSLEDAQKLRVGEQMAVQFMLSSQSEVPVTVAAVNAVGGSSAVVLQCDYMTSQLAVIRRQPVQIITREITGIRVDNDCIHIIKGQKGVFVLEGNTARFEDIDPIYSGNGYTMSGIDSTDSKRLQIYDSVIENGDDLYDGKVVR